MKQAAILKTYQNLNRWFLRWSFYILCDVFKILSWLCQISKYCVYSFLRNSGNPFLKHTGRRLSSFLHSCQKSHVCVHSPLRLRLTLKNSIHINILLKYSPEKSHGSKISTVQTDLPAFKNKWEWFFSKKPWTSLWLLGQIVFPYLALWIKATRLIAPHYMELREHLLLILQMWT